MPKITNPIVKQRIKEALLSGKDDKNSALAGGLSPNSAIHACQLKVLKSSKEEIKNELCDDEIIKRLKKILKLKLALEEKAFKKAQDLDELKQIMQVINKSKDNMTEVIKMLRLMTGESTENIQVDEGRSERLKSMMSRLSLVKN